MEHLNELFDINNDVFGIIKVIVALSGFIALVIKVKEAFSDKQRKQSLKVDLEILQLSQTSNSLSSELIREKVEAQINYLFDKENHNSGGLLGFLSSLIIGVGFSLWTVDIFQKSAGFNPWVILTMFIAGIGFSGLFSTDEGTKKNGEFFRVEFYDSAGLQLSLIIGMISLVSSVALIFIHKEFSWGLFVSGLFLLIAAISLSRSIKFKRIKKAHANTGNTKS